MMGLLLAGTAMVGSGCVTYPQSAGAVRPPKGVTPAPVAVARPAYAYRGHRPYYRPYLWGGGYRGGYYARAPYGQPCR